MYNPFCYHPKPSSRIKLIGYRSIIAACRECHIEFCHTRLTLSHSGLLPSSDNVISCDKTACHTSNPAIMAKTCSIASFIWKPLNILFNVFFDYDMKERFSEKHLHVVLLHFFLKWAVHSHILITELVPGIP